jgi:hypothetical protein
VVEGLLSKDEALSSNPVPQRAFVAPFSLVLHSTSGTSTWYEFVIVTYCNSTWSSEFQTSFLACAELCVP